MSSPARTLVGSDWPGQAEAFLQDLEARRYARASIDRARHVVPRFFAYLSGQGVKDLRAVTLGHIQGFGGELAKAKTREGTPLSVSTRRDYLSSVRIFFGLPREVLSEAQARRLVEAPSAFTRIGQRDRAILELFYGTGLRLGEVERLELQDLDLREGRVLVRDGKGRKDRVVPVTGRALAALDVYLREVRPLLEGHRPSAALFLSLYDTRLSSFSLRAIVRRYGRLAGIPFKVSTHVLRHTCATHLLKGGADVRQIQPLLGHKDIETTERYTRVAIPDLRAVIERAHPRSRRR